METHCSFPIMVKLIMENGRKTPKKALESINGLMGTGTSEITGREEEKVME